jgi:hypothetical protein
MTTKIPNQAEQTPMSQLQRKINLANKTLNRSNYFFNLKNNTYRYQIIYSLLNFITNTPINDITNTCTDSTQPTGICL